MSELVQKVDVLKDTHQLVASSGTAQIRSRPAPEAKRGELSNNATDAEVQIQATISAQRALGRSSNKATATAAELGTTEAEPKAATTDALAQDGADSCPYLSIMGTADASGMRPPVTSEVDLNKEIHRLKEDNKILRAAYRLSHENQRLQEQLEATSLELKSISKRCDEEAKLLSESRGQRLLAAQMFLTETDSLSMSELDQKADALAPMNQ